LVIVDPPARAAAAMVDEKKQGDKGAIGHA
jgi:hypothetical protein